MTPPGGQAYSGTSILRVEDARALVGQNRYVRDFEPLGTIHLAFVRSYIAHALIAKVEVSEALGCDGVFGVFTAADIGQQINNKMGPPQPLLACKEVTYVGQPVAVVAASNRYLAEDAAEAVVVEYKKLSQVVGIDEALNGPCMAHQDLSNNVILSDENWPRELDDVFAKADLVLTDEFRTQRQVAMPMETRGVLATYESGSDNLTLVSSTQMPHLLRSAVAEILSLQEASVRVIAPDVGGAFGVKLAVYVEDLVAAVLSQRTGRPVKWISDRTEAFTSDYQSRGARYQVTAAFSKHGEWQGLGVEILSPAGAYVAIPWSGALVESFIGSLCMTGPYKIGAYGYRCLGVLTNTTPTCSYRATGGPAATWITETIIDRAARALGCDRAQIRRQNMIVPGDLPCSNGFGAEIDTDSHIECLDMALEKIDFGSWLDMQATARSEGRVIGLGLASYVAPTAAGVAGSEASLAIPFDSTTVRVEPSGHVTVLTGVSSQGQGLATTLAQIVADQLQIGIENIKVHGGDTLTSPYGGGTHGSRAAVLGGAATRLAALAVAKKLKRIAAHLLEADPKDIELISGGASVRGVPAKSVSIEELAMRAHLQVQSLPDGLEAGLEETRRYVSRRPFTFANGCHAAIVELFRITGHFRILRYVVVQDGGVIINPAIVEGQVRGGVAQGVGSTFLEELAYGFDGTPVGVNLAEYRLPGVDDMPSLVEIYHVQTPSEHPGGMRGIGEAGLHASVAALAGAVEDAIAVSGAQISQLPVSPDRISDLIEAMSPGTES